MQAILIKCLLWEESADSTNPDGKYFGLCSQRKVSVTTTIEEKMKVTSFQCSFILDTEIWFYIEFSHVMK